MSASKIKQAKDFAGGEHLLTSVLRPAALVCDAIGAFAQAIKPPAASQTSCPDLPYLGEDDIVRFEDYYGRSPLQTIKTNSQIPGEKL